MNEEQRLQALLNYRILDTLPEDEFDEIVELASILCGTRISLISLVDSSRQWFKAKKGLPYHEQPREYAFCNHAVQRPNEVMIVNDSLKDDRFIKNPLVAGAPYIRFYAGAPLITPEGYPIGTLCIIDDEPKDITEEQIAALKILAKRVIKMLELKKENFIQNVELNSSKSKLAAIMDQTPDFIVAR